MTKPYIQLDASACTKDSYSNISAHLHVCDDLLEESSEGGAFLVHGRQVRRGDDGERHGVGVDVDFF